MKIEAIDINNSKTKGVNKEMDIGFMTDLQLAENRQLALADFYMKEKSKYQKQARGI